MESKTKTDAAGNQEINKENMATAAAAALAAAAVKSKVWACLYAYCNDLLLLQYYYLNVFSSNLEVLFKTRA